MGNNIYASALAPGTVLHGGAHDYKIERVLGQGSFGITYLATTAVKVTGPLGELETTMQVAVKEFFMKEVNGREGTAVTSGSRGGVYDKYRAKFAREAASLSLLHHKHIVRVLESFEANNTVYYSMEYIDGGSLNERINNTDGLKEAEALHFLRQIGAALSYMHSHNMLHLDLKPGNVMLRGNGDAVLIDFGLSKQFDDDGVPETSTTVGAGTPGYAPIEQANYHGGDGGPLPVTMDVYALGATAYKMLTGERPPLAEELLNDGFPYGKFRKRGVSEPMIGLVAKAMSVQKRNRQQAVAEFLAELEAAASGGQPSVEDTRTVVTEASEDTVVADRDGGDGHTLEVDKEEYGGDEAATGNPRTNRRKVAIMAVAVLVVAAFMVVKCGCGGTDAELSSPDLDSVAVEVADSVLADTVAVVEDAVQDVEPVKQQDMAEPNNEKTNVEPSHSAEKKPREAPSNRILDDVDQMPEFPGGNAALVEYLSTNVEYPAVALENGVQGRVMVSFVVERDGSLSDVRVLKSVDPLLDKEALRVVRSMPKWTPGMMDGSPVRVKYTIPITFRLQ